jgi:hypothetical protein
MIRGYDDVRALAREIGCRADDLLALAPANDPFYAHVPARLEAARWFADCWVRCGFAQGVHLRRTHYVLVSQSPPVLKPNGEPYQNTDNDWKFLDRASLAARYHRLVPPDAFVDRRNPDPIITVLADSWLSTRLRVDDCFPELALGLPEELTLPEYYLQGFEARQDFLVEVWVEKSTVNDILEPLARRLGFNLVSGVGEMSETAARNAVGRAADVRKPMRIFYCSDFDPGGRSMPVALARKIEFILADSELDLDIVLQPIILTPEQCTHFDLPRTPIKETERRSAKFERRFGAGATELDALEALYPGELVKIVEAEVCRYIDPTLPHRVEAARKEIEDDLLILESEIQDAYDHASISERLDDLRESAERLDAEAAGVWAAIGEALEMNAPIIEPDQVPRAREASPHEAPLFDSKRDYLTQIDAYRAWQGRDEA